MSSSKRYTFKIIVKFNSNSNKKESNHTLEYRSSRNYTDSLRISSNTAEITGSRSENPDFDYVFKNHRSEIYFQFVKSYVYYSIINGIIPEIKSIACYKNNDVFEKEYSQGDIKNIQLKKGLSKNDPSCLKKINAKKLEVIFRSDKAGINYLHATTTLISSLCSNNDHRFENLWKSYNAIYRVRSKNKRECECLNEMGLLMLNNDQEFPLSKARVKDITDNDILQNTLWDLMLENRFVTRMKKERREREFSYFLNKYDDFRLAHIAKEMIEFKGITWGDLTLKRKTLAKIEERLLSKINKDIELVDVLCNYYMYYLRNTMFHGEKVDYSFRFIRYDKESITLDFSSELLFLTICDLINNHDYNQ